jgi:hypothetical protein
VGEQTHPGIGGRHPRRFRDQAGIERFIIAVRSDQLTERQIGAYHIDASGFERQRCRVPWFEPNHRCKSSRFQIASGALERLLIRITANCQPCWPEEQTFDQQRSRAAGKVQHTVRGGGTGQSHHHRSEGSIERARPVTHAPGAGCQRARRQSHQYFPAAVRLCAAQANEEIALIVCQRQTGMGGECFLDAGHNRRVGSCGTQAQSAIVFWFCERSHQLQRR